MNKFTFKIINKYTITLVSLFFAITTCLANNTLNTSFKEQYPGKNWMQYKTPEEAGWSADKLKKAYDYYKKIDCTKLMVVYKGKVLVSWGNVDRRLMCASVRKSFLSALYGIYAGKKEININSPLKKFAITATPPLSAKEQQTTIKQMLTCTARIYRPGIGESENFAKERMGLAKKIESIKKPYFYYNTWTFNVLGAIFNKATKTDLFKDFYNQIAKPIGMQDFSLYDGWYESFNKKEYPKYAFRMSTRDMARFGLLYLRDGKWNNKQIIPKDWIEQSIKDYVKTREAFNGYGYLWWVCNTGNFKKDKVYAAIGVGAQTIAVVPKKDLVIVSRADYYYRNRSHWVRQKELLKLINLILKAKTKSPEKVPKLVPLLSTEKKITPYKISKSCLKKVLGNYRLTLNFSKKELKENELPSSVLNAEIKLHDNKIIFTSPFTPGSKLILIPISKNKFMCRDSRWTLTFGKDKNGNEIFTWKIKNYSFILHKEND